MDIFLDAIENENNSIFDILTAISNIDINETDCFGNTRLHYAVIKGDYKIVKLLLDNKSDTYIKNNENKTPINLAKDNKNDVLVRLLLFYGNNSDQICNLIYSELNNDEGYILINVLLKNKNLKLVKLLIDKKPNLENEYGCTILQLAIYYALRCECADKYLEIVEYAISKGQDINSKINSCCTSLHTSSFFLKFSNNKLFNRKRS